MNPEQRRIWLENNQHRTSVEDKELQDLIQIDKDTKHVEVEKKRKEEVKHTVKPVVKPEEVRTFKQEKKPVR